MPPSETCSNSPGFNLDSVVYDVPLAFVDLETTGLSPLRGHRTCEVAVLRCVGNEAVDALQYLVYPERPVGRGALAVHGLSDELLRDKPPFSAIADEFLEVISGAVLVGHNVGFDLGFLAAEFSLMGGVLPRVCALDTLRLARRVYRAPSYALDALTRSLGVQVSTRMHRAMGDVIATRAVFDRIAHDVCDSGIRTVSDFLSFQGGLVSQPEEPIDCPPVVRRAIASQSLLRLRYRAADGSETDRLVTPLRVISLGGSPCLLAHCHLRDARRTFRLDRVVEADLVSEDE